MYNVLVTGNVKSIFIDNLYSNLCKISNEYRYHILTDCDKDSNNDNIIFYNKNKISVSTLKKVIWFFHFPFLKVIHLLSIKIALGSHNPLTHLKFIKNRYKDYFLASYFEKEIKIQTIHTQTIILDNIWINYFIHDKVKKVYTIWGSDLLRMSKSYFYYNTYRLLSKANIITVGSIHMKEFVLVKYGRPLLEKIFINSFLMSNDIYDAIDSVNLDDIKSFKAKLQIPDDNYIVLIGHSGDKNDQHISILQAIEKQIQTSELKHYTFILPMSYGLGDTYKVELQDYISKSKLKVILQTKYLTIRELATLKKTADYIVMAPISDAHSAFVIESVYAGSCAIVGSWLPYGHFRFIGMPLLEIENMNQIWEIVLKNKKERNLIEIQNIKKSIIKDYFSPSLATNWLEILKN